MNNKATILFADDDPDILEMISYNLEKEGYTVFTAVNGEEAVELSEKVKPDLILLDVMMPKMDGVQVCEAIRSKDLEVQPLIAFLTSRAEDYSQIAGFNAGGDDYINKPIRPKVLLSRIEALLRRAGGNTQPEVNQDLVLDTNRYLLLFKGEELYLPKKEFELLSFLMKKPGIVANRDQILAEVWGDDTIVGERTVDVHIRKLREKIGDTYIRTIKGVGYTFNA
ncbi:response regulator transcription factor [Brumimicrobium glaciale]|uniref:Response regulator transcription factor n=1 Tax=Brumimicrobium glaciale TaxID=200475 RepID=A0A4Q4KGP7_9FLAO|nr:response regulator transcription factor [Brumimicrobium glaciale]RYM32331.1 response regulator transcription factor [Brumimicrobium glaciale]